MPPGVHAVDGAHRPTGDKDRIHRLAEIERIGDGGLRRGIKCGVR